MDLRDKSSKRQRFVELLLRFRLIPLFGWLVGYFFFAPDFDDFVSYICFQLFSVNASTFLSCFK